MAMNTCEQPTTQHKDFNFVGMTRFWYIDTI